MADGPPVLEEIPPMPTTDVQELEGWLSSRNCELHNVLEFGVRGSACLAGLTPDVSMGWPRPIIPHVRFDRQKRCQATVSVNQ